MKIAIIVFHNLTLLDLVGFTDALHRLRSMGYIDNLEIKYCALEQEVTDNFGFKIPVDLVKPNLSSFELIFIPGGFGTRTLMHEVSFLQWLETAKPVPLKVSVCTGSLLLGAAGLLDQKKATTHFDEYELLHQYTSQVIEADLVDDHGVITGGAVASSILVGIHICKMVAGDAAAREIAKRMGLPHFYQNADVQIY